MSKKTEPLFSTIESYLNEVLSRIERFQERIIDTCKNILGCDWDCDSDHCAPAFYWHCLEDVKERIEEILAKISPPEEEEEVTKE